MRFGELLALSVPLFEAAPGSHWGIAGPSGRGKTTFLHILAGLLRPIAGRVRWGGADLFSGGEAARDRWRRETIGIVFQDFHLIPELSALSNVLLPAGFDRWSADAFTRNRAIALLDAAGIGIGRAGTRAGVLSRGEQQRVALARALLSRPRLILADEPTASLDRENGAAVARMLTQAARETGATLIAISHDAALLDRMDHVFDLEEAA